MVGQPSIPVEGVSFLLIESSRTSNNEPTYHVRYTHCA